MKQNVRNSTFLVTGGAGYIGSVLTQILLETGYKVRVLDNLTFGGESIVDLLNHPNFDFVKGDVRDTADLKRAMQGVRFVAHLAAIVGDPACAKEPEMARAINLQGAINAYEAANESGVERFVFASTCSNYGKMKDPNAFVTETSELSPVSLYAETKVAFEQFLLGRPRDSGCRPIILRFSTVYGLSRRVRFDLTVNEFTRELALGRELLIFGEQFWRPYCHVFDLARSIVLACEARLNDVSFNVYNVGDTAENYQKQMIVEEIKQLIPAARVKYVARDDDPRDYRVNCDKIRDELGFELTMRVPDGIRQIKQALDDGFIRDPDDAKFRNI